MTQIALKKKRLVDFFKRIDSDPDIHIEVWDDERNSNRMCVAQSIRLVMPEDGYARIIISENDR